MEKAFHDLLLEANISITTIEILKDEQILTLDTFLSLELDHFTSLNKRIKIGQHALLLRLWHDKTSGATERPIPSHKLRSPSPFSSASSSQSVQQAEAVRTTIKELASIYKNKNAKPLPKKSGIDPRKMTIILGGMHYSSQLCKGVKSRTIPQPNPQKVELSKNSSFDDILSHAKELFFGEETDSTKMNLADSAGKTIHVDKSQWQLANYYSDNGYQPSRHKLYIVYDIEADTSEELIFGDEQDEDSLPATIQNRKGFVCKGCGRCS